MWIVFQVSHILVHPIISIIILVNLGKKLLDGSVYDVKQQFKEHVFSVNTQNKIENYPDFVSILEKYFKINSVNAAYSSTIGNILNDMYADPVASSIEIGRRGYEFYNQYISKVKEIKKNIIRPNLSMFNKLYLKSLEEFKL